MTTKTFYQKTNYEQTEMLKYHHPKNNYWNNYFYLMSIFPGLCKEIHIM